MSSDRNTVPPGSAPANNNITVLVITAETAEVSGRLTISDAFSSTTVGEIRNKIQALIPSRPALQRLRLICAGRLLAQDGQTLEDIVGKEALQHRKMVTIHLALRPLSNSSQPIQGIAAETRPNTYQQPVPPLQNRHPVASPPSHPLAGSPGPATQPAPAPTAQPLAEATPQAQVGSNQRPMNVGEGVDRFRLQEQMMRQHLHATQMALQHIAQHAARNSAHATSHIGRNNGQPPTGSLPIQDFQRRINEQHLARQHPVHQANYRTTTGTTGVLNGQQQQQQGENHVNAPIGSTASHTGSSPSHLPQSTAQFAYPQQVRDFPPRLQSNMASTIQSLNPSIASPGSQFLGTNTMREYENIYLLSSPEGYRAIILSPPIIRTIPTRLNFATNLGAGNLVNNATLPLQNTGANNEAEPQPERIGFQEILGILLPFGGHLWLLARLVFFTTVLTWRADWSRTILVCIGMMLIFLFQVGLLRPVQAIAERAWTPVRHHIEGLVRDIEVDRQLPEGDNRADPDPRATAERLLRIRREQSLARRAERSIALFVASFVPGVGEAQVAAREAAERQRRREAEERQAQLQREREERDAAEQRDAAAQSVEPQTEAGSENTRPLNQVSNLQSDNANEDGGLRQRQPRVEEGSDEDA